MYTTNVDQIYLFSGENHYALWQERRRWVKGFFDRHGGENCMELDAKSVKFRELLDEVSSAPFIAEKRLIIIEGQMKLSKEEVTQLKEQIHPGVLLLFIVPLAAERRGKLPAIMKAIEKEAQCKTFPSLARPQLLQWIDVTLKEHGGSITNEARTKLLEIVGEDQGSLFQEIAKLSLYAQGKPIDVQHVLDLAVCAGEQEMWHLMDLLGAGKVEEAIQEVRGALERGENPQGIWVRLLWMVSQLTLVWMAVQDGVMNPASITKHVGASFPTARAFLPCARRLSRESLERIVATVAEMDKDLKTGVYRATGEAPEELNALIDKCILSFSS